MSKKKFTVVVPRKKDRNPLVAVTRKLKSGAHVKTKRAIERAERSRDDE